MVLVWLIGLMASAEERHAVWRTALPREELLAASRAAPAAEARWTARAALRLLLAEELGAPAAKLEGSTAGPRPFPAEPLALAADPRAYAPDLRLCLGEHGKPFLRDHPELRFSLSHSGATAVVALSRASPIGIDLEYHRPRPHALAMAKRWLADGSEYGLVPLVGSERDVAFLRLWTIHEAFAKAIGCGLRIDLRKVLIQPGPPWPARIAHPDHEGVDWRYQPLAIPAHSATVVAPGGDWDMGLRSTSVGQLLASGGDSQ
jgi:4'-phosphopantetheinyl transferase superfamily